MAPVLTVIVPFANAEESLDQSLLSIAEQELAEIEVLLVDDGSTDNSAVIAKTWVDRDSRFHLTQSTGVARNAGLQQAEGHYVAFVDGGDIVPANGFAALVASLESTGSDLACGSTLEIGEGGEVSACLDGAVVRTHVRDNPRLLMDRTIRNKIYRRSFWESCGLRFGGGHYDEIRVAIASHVYSSSTDVIDEVVHRREASPFVEIENALLDRFDALRASQTLVETHLPRLSRDLNRQILELDVSVGIGAITRVEPGERGLLLARMAPFLAKVDAKMLKALPVLDRLKVYLAQRAMLDELCEVLAFERNSQVSASLVRRGSIRPTWYLTYPFFEDADRNIPSRIYRAGQETQIQAQVDNVSWEGGSLRIEGAAYVEGLGMAEQGQVRLKVWLRNARTGAKVPIRHQRVRRPDVTARAGRGRINYDWCGFEAQIDHAKPGGWEVWVSLEAPGLRRLGAATGPEHGYLDVETGADLHWRVPPAVGKKPFHLRVSQTQAMVTAVEAADTGFVLQGWVKAKLAGELVGKNATGKVDVRLDLHARHQGRCSFTAYLPYADISSETEFFFRGERETRLCIADGVEARAGTGHGDELALTSTRFGNLCAVVRPSWPVVDSLAWDERGALVLSGEFTTGEQRSSTMCLRRRRSTEERFVPLRWEGSRFSAEVLPSEVPSAGGRLPLASGLWDVLLEADLPLRVSRSTIGDLSATRRAGSHVVAVHPQRRDTLVLRSALAPEPNVRQAPRSTSVRRDLVLFESYEGRQLSCNPRAVFEELQRRDLGVNLVWGSRDGQFPAPDGAEVVYRGSSRYHEVQSEAGLIVNNWSRRNAPSKSPGQLYVQTWHGTPLKKLGYDLKVTSFRGAETFSWIREDVPTWDLLLSPSPFATEIMRRAYGFDGEVLESGYPRNDLLKRPELAAEVRRRIGVPEGKKVVLYAPTWRDDHRVRGGRRSFHLELDLERAQRALGDDHVLLVRTHYLVTDRPRLPSGGFVMDVTHYPDIAELYLAADVLITDYSSAMFDYCNTGRPMIFFAYDLERYRDAARGFYFDFEREAPGPLARTSDDVIEAISQLSDLTAGYGEQYARFQEKYCPYDDGQASARVVDRIIASGALSR